MFVVCDLFPCVITYGIIKLMGLFSSSKKDTLIVAFDIASSSIGGILFSYHPEKLPEIIASARFSTDFLPELNFQKIQRSLHKTFERTISSLKKKMSEKRRKPDLAAITFSLPYYISQSRMVRLSKPRPFEITSNFLKNMIADEGASFKKQWQEKHQTKDGNEVEIMETEEMNVKLNGYPVRQPIGKRARSLDISLYLSLGIKPIQDKLRECVFHSFSEMPVRFQSFPFIAYAALKKIMDFSRNIILVDIGGEITDLILIRDGVLEETVSFPFGENFLIRRLASTFHFSLGESFSLLRQYARGDLHADINNKIKKVIEDASAKWCQFFQDSFRGFLEVSFVPQNLLFIGGEGAMAFKDFAPCIKDQPLVSQFLLAEALKDHFVFRRGFGEDKDISLMLLALTADKLLKNKE